jgi:ankyrin repeat protein
MQIVRAIVTAHPTRPMATNESGMTALHVFSRNLINPEIMAYLIECYPGAVEQPNNFGHLPLHKAAACRHTDGESFKALIAAYPEALLKRDKNGCTPLHQAVTGVKPSLTVCGTLLREGPKAAKRYCKRGELPLHKMAKSFVPDEDTKDTLRVLELLTEAYPDAIRCQDAKGNLPLHLAVQKDVANVEFVNALLFLFPEAAISPNLAGATPQDIAINKGPLRSYSVVSALLNYTNVSEMLARIDAEDAEEDDEEALLALLASSGYDTAFHEDAGSAPPLTIEPIAEGKDVG